MDHNYMSPQQVHERWPFLSVSHLAQLRFTGAAERGEGPKFLKPTPRTVVYRERDVVAWLEASERTSTAVSN
ncbi:helix-turn-helix transcriptional regulator [Microbacterium sp. S1037]|uniref:helix-turn-helix transcriptional regulator n=1 Tax=Microbacterium sp. S1037 TaxID=3398227 RepID=UPI003AAC0097